MTDGAANGTRGFFDRRSSLWLGVTVSLLIALYVLMLITRPDQFFADDTYFYLQVAWNFGRGLGSTFNNIMPTNGYHPLWMLMCAAVFHFFPVKTQGIHVVAGMVAALDVLMLWTVRRLLAKVAGDLWPLAFVLLVPFCFTSQLGTEGALSGLFLSLLMFVGYSYSEMPKTNMAVAFNLTAAITVLSRLDNIFIVSLVWLAVWLAFGETGKAAGRRLQMMMLPIYIVLWGVYLSSNWIWFHTLQPISGMLKSKSKVDHALGANLPHTALFALAVVLVCFVVVAINKRDLFFRVVEVPFTLGVLIHAGYIVLRMSSETRWSWYYTSWILLGGVLLARVGSILMARKRDLALPVAALCVLLLAGAWFKMSYTKAYLQPDRRTPAAFNEVVYRQAGVHSAFAYDEPGMLAYYSDIHIIPLDGLMGDMEFQQDLATKGILAVAAKHHIDGFIGPPMPFDTAESKSFCERFFLSAETLHCTQQGANKWQATSLDVYARVPSGPAGTLVLNPQRIVWSDKKWVAVWRINPAN
jgi:hypothetical protein